MVKTILIKKIEDYLSQEYLIESQKLLMPSFSACGNMCDDEEPYEDASFVAEEKSILPVPKSLKSKKDVEKYIDDTLDETTFAKKLNQYMYEKDLTTAIIYQRCLVDRKLISKITTQAEYHPSKTTVFALCIGLQLDLPEGEEFLSLAGYGFNQSSKYDLIIKFMLENNIYELDTINEMLFYFKQPCFK